MKLEVLEDPQIFFWLSLRLIWDIFFQKACLFENLSDENISTPLVSEFRYSQS